jgi:dTDP-4-dehydrorhamnose reductase
MTLDRQRPAAAIFGAKGFIGKNLLAKFAKDDPRTVGVARNAATGLLSLDLAHPDIDPLELVRRGITHGIIAAAVSGIGDCERQGGSARAVNVQGTAELARQLCARGIKVIAFSSDYVFDGKVGNYGESSPVSPVNEYGRQKAEMEKLLLKACDGNVLILRLGKVFDTIKGSGTLIDEMAGRFMRSEVVSAAQDQFFCPAWIDDVVDVIGRLMTTDASGVMHLCAPRKISRLELARDVAETFGVDPALIKNISLKDLREDFVRPLDTSMVCDRLGGYVKYGFRDVHECIQELFSNYRGNVRDKKTF